MNVTFVLPGATPLPAGGPRMVFRYANALATSGWNVTVIMPAGVEAKPFWRQPRQFARFWLWRFSRSYAPRGWIRLHPGVQLRWVADLAPRCAPQADAVIATAVQTAESVAIWPAYAGRKFYLIQGYETWDSSVARVEASWRLPLMKIAVSTWLCELIAAAGMKAIYLPNGLDHEAFGLDYPLEYGRKPVLLWPHHALAWKGSGDVINAVKMIRPELPELQLQAFGTAPAPKSGFPDLTYYRNPSQIFLRQIYNNASVVVVPSHSEGWGLPACEALQCGCALAASDVGGHREFLRHEINALLHPPGNILALGENILRLFKDASLRRRLASQGLVDMRNIRFEGAVDRLQKILLGETRES